MQGRRSAVAWVVACGLHVAVLLALHVTKGQGHGHAAEVPAPQEAPASEIDVDLSVDRGAPIAAVGATTSPRERLGHEAARARPESASGTTVAEAEHLAGASEEPASDGWAFSPTIPDLNIGLGSRMILGDAGSGVASAGEWRYPTIAKPSSNGGLSEGLAARDREIGLTRGGAVRSAVASVVGRSDVLGVATFQIAIDTTGRVSVVMLDATTDAGWNGLTEAIRAEVTAARDRIRLPPNRGLEVTVRAEAIERLPDGRTKPQGAGVHTTPLREKDGKIELPSATVYYVGKVCGVGVQVFPPVPAAFGGCSPENAGATFVRKVAATIVDESAM